MAEVDAEETHQKYTHLKTLGRGSFGEAILASLPGSGQLVVIKVARCSSRNGVIEALSECCMLRVCRSPYIVQYLDSYQHGLMVSS